MAWWLAAATLLFTLSSVAPQDAPAIVTTVLFTTGNVTKDGTKPAPSSTCSVTDQTSPPRGSEVSAKDLASRTVAAKYWGRDSAKLEDFTVPSNCSGLNLPKAGSLNIYRGPSEQGCKAVVYGSNKAVTIQVSILGSNDSWSVRFPVNPASPTSVACVASKKGDCTLAAAPPCTAFDSSAANPNYLSSFIGESDCDTAKCQYNNRQCNNTCAVGSPLGIDIGGRPASHGLYTTYYQLRSCDRDFSPNTPYALPNFTALTPDPQAPARCQQALDYQAFNTTWPAGNPPLNTSIYAGCFGAQLDGFVRVDNNTLLQDLTYDHPADIHNRFQVCLRTNALARLVINGRTLVSSIPNINFDSTLGCVDTILPIGWQKIHVEYAGIPEQTISILQLYIIPVATVYNFPIPQVFNVFNNPSVNYGYTWLCEAGQAFNIVEGTCKAIATCATASWCSDRMPQSPPPPPNGVPLPPQESPSQPPVDSPPLASPPAGTPPAPAPPLPVFSPPPTTVPATPPVLPPVGVPPTIPGSSPPAVTPPTPGATPPVLPPSAGVPPRTLPPTPAEGPVLPPTIGMPPVPSAYGSPPPSGVYGSPPPMGPAAGPSLPPLYGSPPPIAGPVGAPPPGVAVPPGVYGGPPPKGPQPGPSVPPMATPPTPAGGTAPSSAPPSIPPSASGPLPSASPPLVTPPVKSPPVASPPVPSSTPDTNSPPVQPPVLPPNPSGYGSPPPTGGYGVPPSGGVPPTGPPTAPPPSNCDCSARLEELIRNANSFDDLKALLASGGV